jgi:serine---pyruvate transaminase
MIYPHGPEFAALLADCVSGVQWALSTNNAVVLVPSSGTGALEAVVVNLLRPGHRAVFCVNGYWSELWAKIAERRGVDVIRVAADWGAAVDVHAVARTLRSDRRIEAVFITHNETSTGVLSDVATTAALAHRHGCLSVVDSISGAPCHPLAIDDLQLDVVVTASQKGWFAPPGLAMVILSAAARDAAERAACPSWYFDLSRPLSLQQEGRMHVTPPVTTMYALREGVQMIREEGLSKFWARHERIGLAVREGLQETGLALLARNGRFSSTVTAVRSPWSSAGALSEFLADVRDTHGVVLAHGLGHLSTSSFRIGHLGEIAMADVHVTLAAVRAGLQRRAGFAAVA